MSEVTMTVGKDVHKIECKPLTLVCKAPNLLDKIEYPGRLRVEPEHSLYHAERVQVFHARTPGFIAQIFKLKDASEITPDWCRSKSTEVLRVAGLVDMALKFAIKGVPVVFIQPETGLHPAQCCELADFFIAMNNDPEQSVQETMVDNIMEQD
jgi:hypothetical protein